MPQWLNAGRVQAPSAPASCYAARHGQPRRLPGAGERDGV